MQRRHTDRERYFEESSRTSSNNYMSYIEQFHRIKSRSKILEVGCGEGGNLLPFAQRGCDVVGIDMSESRIQQAQHYFHKHDMRGAFICCNFLSCTSPMAEIEKYDVILLHDVIEHIRDKHAFIGHLVKFLKSDGILFVAFPAWQMPFGGHQQICHHRFWSIVPYGHLLPTRVYHFILKRLAHESTATINELLEIKSCKVSVESFEKIVQNLPINIINRKLWFINPHYQEKFGLYPRALPSFLSQIPHLRNYFSTSCFYLLRLRQQRSCEHGSY